MNARILSTCTALLIVTCSAVLLWGGLTNGHNWGDDFAQYIMQAKSIVEHKPAEFIATNRFIVENSEYAVGPVTYPWGFPALLAPVYALFGLDLIALKAVNVVCFLLFLLVLWHGFGRSHTNPGRMLLLALFALNPDMLSIIDSIVADISFLLASTCGVLLIGRLAVDRRPLISPVWDQVLLGVAIAAAFLIRLNGALLLVALAVTQLVDLFNSVYRPDASANQRRFDAAVLLRRPDAIRLAVLSVLPYVSFAGFVLVCRLLLPDGGLSAQGSIFSALSVDTIRRNVNIYAGMPAEFFGGVPHRDVLFGATIPLAIAGAAVRLRRDYHVVVYAASTMLLYILWPTTGGLRYLFPILPFYFSFAVSGVEYYAARSQRPARTLVPAMCVVPVLVVLAYFARQSIDDASANMARSRQEASGPFAATSRDAFEYIRHTSEPDATIVFFKPRLMSLMTGRRSVKLFKVRDLPRGDYLCLYRPDEMLDQMLPSEVKCLIGKGAMERVYTNPEFAVYRLLKSDESAWQTSEECASPRIY